MIEERKGNLYGYEIKWKADKSKAPKDWAKLYPNSKYTTINRDNYLGFIA